MNERMNERKLPDIAWVSVVVRMRTVVDGAAVTNDNLTFSWISARALNCF